MAFQPTSPTRRYSDYRRAVQVKRKRTASLAKSEKASIAMASPPPTAIPEHSEAESTPPAAAPRKTSASEKAATGGLTRSGSLSDRLRSSWKGGVSSLLKKSQDNVRAEAIAKARRTKDPQATTSSPGSAASHAKGNAKSKTKNPVELPVPSKSRKETDETKVNSSTTKASILGRSESPRFTALATSDAAAPPPVPPKSPPAASQPLQPGSFFNDDSSDEEDESPVLQRASSVHVGKPTLVRHYSNATASQAVKRGHSPAPRSGLSQEETAKESNPDKAAAEDGDAEDLSLSHAADLSEGPEDALSRLEGSPTKISSKPLPLTPSTTAPQISPSKPLVASPSTYGSAPTASSDSQATAAIITAPAPALTSASGNHPQGTPFPTPLSPLSALHSNPVSPATAVTGSRLSRALSAPTPPNNYNNRSANRRVTIRPSDLVINHSEHEHRLFRDSIVTTPYPERGSGGGKAKNRLSDIPDGQEAGEGQLLDGGAKDEKVNVDSTPRPSIANENENADTTTGQQQQHVTLLDPSTSIPMSPHGPGDRDRFPSLTSSESFLLTLSIAGHPTLSTTIEIDVPSSPSSNTPPTTSATLSLRTHRRKTLTKPTKPFDDAALFALLRQHYHTLLGPRRLLATRTLHHASPSSPDTPLDAPSFLAHLRTPSLGADNRHWLLWLRNQQPVSKRASSLFSGPNPPTTTNPASVLAPNHTYAHHHGGGNTMLGGGGPTANSPTYPRMPFQRSEARNAPPHIVLHFRHNALTISLAVGASLVVGALAVVIWVLLGVPGLGAGDHAINSAADFGDAGSVFDALSSAGDDNLDLGGLGVIGEGKQDVVRTGGSYYGDWRVDSQMRVLTGLVLGVAVAGGGVLVTGAWGLAGWILL